MSALYEDVLSQYLNVQFNEGVEHFDAELASSQSPLQDPESLAG